MKRHFPALFRLFGFVCAIAGAGSAQAQDAFEPDNAPTAARIIGNGETQNRSISPAGDEDWAVFTIGANGATTIRIETAGVPGFVGDTEIWLYDARNLTKELAYNDNAAPNTTFSLITLTNLAAGTYYIKVGAVGGQSAIAGYTLRASWTDQTDSFESDNTPATAKAIANNTPQERSLHAAGDQDWAAFTIGANGATNVRIETTGTSGDTEMWLYGPNSSTTELAYNDDGPAGKFSLITLNSLAAGTYFIKVTAFGLGSTVSAYTLRASWTETGDAFESDDTPATAKPITNGQSENHSIHVIGDVDWATFTLGSNGATNVRIETAGISGDTEIWLYGPNSSTAQLGYNDDGGNGKFSQITMNSLPAGTYYIKVGEFGNDSTISAYTLRLTWTEGLPPTPGDSFESDDLPTTAKTIANGEAQSRSIHVATDVDWIRFTIGSVGASNVRIETTGSSGDTEMWLYGPDSTTTELNYNDDGGSGKFALISRPSLGPGTYYIRVNSYRLSTPIAAYTLNASWTVGLPPPSRIVNLSVRTNAGTGSQTAIVGFVVSGTGTRQVLLRGVGPTLEGFGVTGALADPTMQLFTGTTSTATNDNWGANAAIRTAAASVGAFALPDTSRDASLLQTLGAGNYSVQIGGGTGVVLVEAYEVGTGLAPRLSNVSARAQVGTEGNILIAGFVIAGLEAKTVLIRAIGPSLTQFGVTGSLVDPKLEVFRESLLIDSNDNWDGAASLSTAFGRVGAFPLAQNSRDAALQLTLLPGAYSAQISGINGTTGAALVEVYEVP